VTDQARPSPQFDATRGIGVRRFRLRLLAAIAALLAGTLIGRLAYVQLAMHSYYASMATEEHWRQIAVPPRRGDILDTTGVPLATTVTYESLYASTSEISNPARLAAALAPILGTAAESLQATLSKKSSAPTLIQGSLTEEKVDQIKKLELDGIFFELEPKRVYPQGSLAAQLLGVVGADNNGLSGVELSFDQDLAGKPGSIVAERDTSGSAIAFSPQRFQAPADGKALTLTIDRYVQWVAERELVATVQAHHAHGGTVVVLNPADGAVLAAASLPTLDRQDPDPYSESQVALYGIPAVARATMPGTVFNVFTAATALASGVVTPASSFDNVGSLTYVGAVVTDTVPIAPGPMSVVQAVAFGSKVGASWMGTTVGPYRYYDSLHSLELGQKTGIDLPGEVDGLLRIPTDLDWTSMDLATNAFGQGISVTPIQLAAATAAIANGGVPARPYVVRRIGAAGVQRDVSPVYLPAAMGAAAARAMASMLQTIVDDPRTTEGRLARVDGYALGGKAGSAIVPDSTSPGQTAVEATFVGFGPVDRPRFAIVVQIDAPTDAVAPDEITSATFSAIAHQLLNYYQIPPSRAPGATAR
jgi:cell division protein FtsI (penicillin-binding protein 3)